jgi:hypothetical protein
MLLSPTSLFVLYLKNFKAYNVFGKLAADILERSDASPVLKGCP